MKNKKKLVLFLAASTLIVLGLRAWQDELLFTKIVGGKGKSNVILVQDHTGSMCSIIYHPDYNPKISLSTYSNVDLPYSTTNYDGISQTSWYLRWCKTITIADSAGRFAIHAWNPATYVLSMITGTTSTNIKNNDWILQYRDADTTRGDDAIEFNINYQMVAKVTNVSTSGSGASKVTNLTLDSTTIKGTPTAGANYYVGYYSDNTYTPRVVKLYGSTLDQGGYNVAYTMDPDLYYLRWIFGVANDTQRQQVTDFSTLAYDIEYNGYLRATPVKPDLAYALNEKYPLVFNSNSTVFLLAEWNTVMKDIYPNKIANLRIDKPDVAVGDTTIYYEKHKASFAGYTTPGFRIKIDAETMIVNSNVLDASGNWGTLTVTRGTLATTGTVAAAHPAGAAIMIYNNAGLGIDEYTPLTSLFSSLQHVTEATGDVDQTWTEAKAWTVDGTNYSRAACWRYKRVFTRIQVAREALCDVITAKNKLLKAADLVAAASDFATNLTYNSFTARTDFLAMAAPFYIKVVDANGTSNPEIMLVTAHDPATSNLTVTRHQQGTSACAHTVDSIISTYSGTRDLVRFGIFKFSADDNLATEALVVGLNDFGQKNTDGTYKAAAYINTAILDKVDLLRGNGSTPLARALTYVWNYLKPNTGANYINTSDWKAVDKDTFGTAEKFQTLPGATHLSPIGSPMEYWCQENYAVMITDGEATADSGNMGYGVFSQGSQKTPLCGNISSDFTKFDYNLSTNPTPWGDTVNDGSEYLPDVAYFLSHQDMFPTTRIITGHWNTTKPTGYPNGNNYYDSGTPEADPDGKLYSETDTDVYKRWPGNQNIKTYTIGLCVSNTVLPKAAKNGGGASFTASNYRDLSDAFINIITSVELSQQPMTYTTYAAPKQSITGGNYGYVAHFIPRLRSMWEGHLRRYRLGDDGSFPDNIDNPAAYVVVGGANVISFQWDAGEILNTRTTARVVYTSKPSSGSWPRLDFMGSSITAADLYVTSGQVAQVKNFTQNFNKADGIDANSEYNGLYRLGETFHCNPQLVGYPLIWKANFDLSYKSFYDRYSAGGASTRAEVVYAGANDGKMHCFQASNGNELWSYVPFAHLKKLKDKLVYNPLIHTYYIDGKSLVKDIKVAKSDGTFYNDYRDWKTGLFFGMGIGGRSYCALDVTTPADLKILWETDEDAETTADGRMGFTEAKPVVVDMNGGGTLGTFPAVILPGGYNACEEKATEMSVLPWQRREGKALYILNANTGALVKKFIYGATASTSATIDVVPGFLTAMTAAPAVLDKNNDGIADVIYLAESGDYRTANAYGGAIWKINCYGDPANWVAQKIYQAEDGQTIFVSPSLAYDNDYRVWLMFGTGRRSQPVDGLGTGSGFTNLTGQFVAFIDDNSGTTVTNADLHEAATSGDATYTIDNSGTVKKGFWFDFHFAHEIMYEPQPLYINSQVYFMTFTPQEGTGSPGGEVCGGSSTVNGKHYIYQFKLTSAGNTFIIGDFLIQSGKILGLGPMGDKFIIYVGAGDAGNFKPNAGVGGTITFTIENKNSTMFWKEDKK